MILYKKENFRGFLKEYFLIWFWGTLIFFGIGFIFAILSIIFDYIF